MSEPLLFLSHRLPYPPNKGDKVRSYHMLRHLAKSHDVFLGTFIDDPEDLRHVETVRSWCADVFAGQIVCWRSKLRSLRGFVTGTALTLPYYRDAQLRAWIERTVREYNIRRAFVYSSALAQYVIDDPRLACVVDFVDIDSDKWRQYAEGRRWPQSFVYRRESETLLRFERRVASRAAAGLFVTEAEAQMFRGLAPECAGSVFGLDNGVDAEYFRPNPARASPFDERVRAIVFTGAMDYWPNIDAVSWFARDILPSIRQRAPGAHFYVVGMNPAPAVRELSQVEGVTVTGRVPDVRPFVQHAAVVVAPLRVARGVQNKVLEAMAMGRPVVTSAACGAALAAQPGRDFEVAESAVEFANKVVELFDPRRGALMGVAARERVLAGYDWEANLRRLDEIFSALPGRLIAPAPLVGRSEARRRSGSESANAAQEIASALPDTSR